MRADIGILDPRRQFAVLLCCMLALTPALARPQQPAPKKLNIVILEGEGAINNVQQRTAREPIVQVTDENDRPVAGATVYFLLPESGPGGSFADGARSLNVVTDAKGQATARGLTANAETGKYQIQVEASYQELTTTTTINQANAVLTAAAAGGGAGKIIAILAIIGGAAAAGVVAATSGNGSSSPAPPPAPTPTTVTPGAPSVGGP